MDEPPGTLKKSVARSHAFSKGKNSVEDLGSPASVLAKTSEEGLRISDLGAGFDGDQIEQLAPTANLHERPKNSLATQSFGENSKRDGMMDALESNHLVGRPAADELVGAAPANVIKKIVTSHWLRCIPRSSKDNSWGLAYGRSMPGRQLRWAGILQMLGRRLQPDDPSSRNTESP